MNYLIQTGSLMPESYMSGQERLSTRWPDGRKKSFHWRFASLSATQFTMTEAHLLDAGIVAWNRVLLSNTPACNPAVALTDNTPLVAYRIAVLHLHRHHHNKNQWKRRDYGRCVTAQTCLPRFVLDGSDDPSRWPLPQKSCMDRSVGRSPQI